MALTYATCTDGMVQVLNNVWNGLVNEVEATKRHYEKLEARMITTNDHLNNGITALNNRVEKLEDKFCTIHNCYDDFHVLLNDQGCKIYDMDKQISFYSQSVIRLENKKAEAMKDRFDVLEQCIAGQDDQIKILLHYLAAAEEGCCHCQESTPKVISCCCFNMITRLTEDVQETKDETETRGLEYKDEEVEAFCHPLMFRN